MAQKQYFRHFPTIDFDLKNDGNLIKAKDIFRNIRVSSGAEDAISGYEFYYIQDQDRPDVTATKLYGDATLYWLFWMVNPHLAVHSDWPKSQRVLERFIKRKYSGKAIVAPFQSDIVSNSDSKFFQGEKVVGSTSSAFGYVTKVDPTNKQLILNDIEGIFINGAHDVSISTIRFKGNEYAVYVEDSQRALIDNNEFDLEDYGIYFTGSSSSATVEYNKFRRRFYTTLYIQTR